MRGIELTGRQVIQKIGLGICFYDLLKASEGQIGHDNTGIVNVNGPNSLYKLPGSLLTDPVVFRLLVFRPFRSEIICGRIASATEQGMKSAFSLALIFP